MKTDKDKIIDEIKDDIELNESRLNNIYSTPLTEGGMDFLMTNIDSITFCENEIENDIDELDIWEEEDEVVKSFFGISSSINDKSNRSNMKIIPEIPNDKVVLLNISRCYNADDKEDDIYKRPSVYEMVRKYWKVDKSHVEQADYVFGVANGIVIAVYTDMRWKYEEYNGYLRCSFEGVEVKDSKYLGLKVSDYIRSQNPVTYINC